MKLEQYIDEFFNGNKAAFGRAFGRSPQHITKLFQSVDNWMIVIEEDKHLLVQIRCERNI